MRLMSILLAALVLAADPTVAHAPAPAQSSPAAQKEQEKKICRVDTSDSSSRLRKSVCMTQTEWDRKAEGKSEGDLRTMGAE
jgi:hypothetical protein